MIRLRGVSFAYRAGEPVLDKVDLAIAAGLTLLLGPNGCGKSTLMRLIAGVERPDAGRVEIGALDLWTAEAAARKDLAYVPEQPDLTPYATVEEILRLVCRLRGEPSAGSAIDSHPAAAQRAITVRDRIAVVHDPLPTAGAGRMTLLESLARGEPRR